VHREAALLGGSLLALPLYNAMIINHARVKKDLHKALASSDIGCVSLLEIA
jgi:hypothetical protein